MELGIAIGIQRIKLNKNARIFMKVSADLGRYVSMRVISWGFHFSDKLMHYQMNLYGNPRIFLKPQASFGKGSKLKPYTLSFE